MFVLTIAYLHREFMSAAALLKLELEILLELFEFELFKSDLAFDRHFRLKLQARHLDLGAEFLLQPVGW